MYVPPLIRVGLWAVGLCAAGLSAAESASAQSGADACALPDSISGTGSFGFDNSTATTGTQGQNQPLCYLAGSSTVDHDVWFSWTPGTSGIATLRTCGSAVDTKLAAYSRSGCPTSTSALACDDDTCGLQSEISFAVQAGSFYTLQVGTFPGSPGGVGVLDISVASVPANDDCASPTPVFGPGSVAFDTSTATTGAQGQSEASCYFLGSSAIEHDLWYRWFPTSSGTAIVSTCGSNLDTKLAAYAGSSCPTQGSALACNDDDCALQSRVHFPVTSGTAYMLQVGTFPGAAGGPGSLDFAVSAPPASDDCSSPAVIAGQGSFPFDTSLATAGAEGQLEALCDEFGQTGIDHDVWFDWTADVSGLARFSTCGVGLDTKLAIYPGGGCPTNGTSLACNDDSTACGGVQAEVELEVVAGVSYLVQLGNFPGASAGAGNLAITISPPLVPGTVFCGCEGAAAPCDNPGTASSGCANGSSATGVALDGTGFAQVGADSLRLSASGLPPNQPGLFFQAQSDLGGGAGVAFGDGLRCIGGDVRRLGVVLADGAGHSDTSGFTQPISVLGGVALGDLRRYQVWYRDPDGSPCGSLFNLSNGYRVQW